MKEGIFDEQEEIFENNNFNDSNVLDEKTNLFESNFDNFYIFNVYFYLKINEKTENTFMIESDALNINTQCVFDLISNIVKKINSKKINVNDENEDFILSLKENENIDFYNDNYEIRPYDKISHTPKFDYPSFSPKLILDELIEKEICFVVKKCGNIKLSEKSDKE